MLCKPFRQAGGQQQLFEGNRSECRFSEILGKVLANIPEALKLALGANTEDLGTHSARKGAASGFRFPITISTKLIWDLWYFGNIDEKIQPYRFIKPIVDLGVKSDRVAFSKAKFVVNAVQKYARDNQIVLIDIGSTVNSLTKIQSDDLFQIAFPRLMITFVPRIEEVKLSDLLRWYEDIL
jgi:hypothetical protein